MKKILLLGALAMLLVACKKDDKNGLWNMDTMFALNPDTPVRSSRAEGHLTPREVVEKADQILWKYNDSKPSRGFPESRKDYENERLLMDGTDIITFMKLAQNEDYTPFYNPVYVEGQDIVIVTEQIWIQETNEIKFDTIAYIPNRILRAAAAIIKPAFERGDYATCYKVFDEAFTFIPITGAEWRALKDKGEN